jgi:hypothetical protein
MYMVKTLNISRVRDKNSEYTHSEYQSKGDKATCFVDNSVWDDEGLWEADGEDRVDFDRLDGGILKSVLIVKIKS